MKTYLQRLKVTNLALIGQLSLEFEPGLNVITGPTGSGKTMLIKALKLALGERADYDLLKESDASTVKVEFDWNSERSVPFPGVDDNGTLRFRRKLKQNHTSPAFFNGDRIRLKRLRKNRTDLIDFHGQHDNQAVFEKDFARRVLDRFGDYEDILQEYQSRYRTFSTLEKDLESLQGNEAELKERLELLDYQLSELAEFDPGEEEWSSIEEDRLRLESTEDIERTLKESLEILGGNHSLISRLDQLRQNLETLENFDPDLDDWSAELNSAGVMAEELRRTLNDYRQKLSGSAQEYERLMKRRSRWLELARKHNVSPDHLYEEYQSLKDQREDIENREQRKAELTDRLEAIEEELYERADELHLRRVESADRLEKAVNDTLRDLNLANAIFEIRVDQNELGETGYDEVRWLFSSHETQQLGPLSSRISGGEISRVLLAIKSALAEADRTPVLVFDEIDTGISGEEASLVGEVLAELASYHQVLCITHLPLVASRADHHIRVSRRDQLEGVSIQADSLEGSSRIDELSRLLSGDQSSDVSREQARELLEVDK